MTKPTSTTTGTIIRHGEAPYQHNPNNSLNYFVEVEIEKDKYETLWGVQLKELVESQQLEVGEKVSFHKFKQETGANKWEAARYFEVEKLENSIGRDFSQEKLTELVSEFGQSKVKQSADYTTDDTEYIVPNAIRNRYLSVAVNQHTDSPTVKFYERENPAAVAFEDRGDKGLHTSKSDKDTIKAMLDMAQSKGWESIKLKGSEEFKREAWMEAQMRGIKTKGYEPTEKDKLELQARQEERTTNQVEMVAQKMPETKEQAKEFNAQIQNKEPIKEPVVLDISSYHHLDSKKQDEAYLDRIGADFAGVQMERTALNFDEVKANAKNFTGKNLTNFHSGITAIISNNSLSKMLSGKAYNKSVDLKTHLIAVSNADKLFENAVFGWQHEHKGADQNADIGAVHRAIAPLKVNNEIYLAKLTVKEFAYDGNRVYSVEAVEINHEKSPIPEMVANDLEYKAKTDRHNGTLIDIIVKNAQDFNRNQQKILDIEAVDIEHEKSPVPEMTEEDAKKYVVTPHRLNEASINIIAKNGQDFNQNQHKTLENHENLEVSEFGQSSVVADKDRNIETDREEVEKAAQQHHDLKEVETEAYVRAEEFQHGRDIDPDLDMNVAGEAESFKNNVVAAPKVASMSQAKVTQKVEAAFDRKIDSSMVAVKRDDFKQDFEENKAKLSENDKVKVEAVRRVLDFLHKDNPKELQTGYEKLTTAMKNGEISKLPDVPQQVVQQSIEVQAPTQSNKDRGR